MSKTDPIHRLAASVLGCVFMLGCSAGSDEGTTSTGVDPGTAGIDYAASAPPGGTLQAGVPSAVAPEFGQVAGDKMLAKVDVSDTHSVTFWQVESGRVLVIESYNVDQNPGAKLVNFRAGRDSYADTYASLAGATANPEALTTLRTADSLVAKVRAERPTSARATTPHQEEVTAAPQFTLPLTADGLTLKSSNDDFIFFQNQVCAPRSSSARGQDLDNCHTAPLFLGQSTTTWNVDMDTANIAILNAAFSGNASLQITSVNCGGLFGWGLCSKLVPHNLVTPPRIVNVLSAEADDRFLTTASGTSYALHYLFWD